MKKQIKQTALLLIIGVIFNSALIAQNMERYITIGVKNGAKINLDLFADKNNTPVRIVSGNKVYNIQVEAEWTGYKKYLSNADTMTIYGDILLFDCWDNGEKLFALDVSHNSKLKKIWCSKNKISSLDLSNNPDLETLYCYTNQITSLDLSNNKKLRYLHCARNKLESLDVSENINLGEILCQINPLNTEALNNFFCSLPRKKANDNAKITILFSPTDDNHADVIASDAQNALDKNWTLVYFSNASPIPATTGEYECSSNIDDIAIDNIEIYPNPAKDLLNIKTDESNFTIDIYNSIGKLVLSAENQNQISISELPNGTYFLQITTKQGVYNQKVVKN